MSLQQQFHTHWQTLPYAASHQTILVAVSGGADSMALAHIMAHCKIPMVVAHCNFGLRGQEADLDQELVETWCKEQSIRCHTIRFDTKTACAEWGMGTQETARKLRYDWFETLRVQEGYARIATAHHANDNVETLLINLCKGTGMAGLHGIPAENGHIIRPLLFATKDAIATYVAANAVPYREDASNATDDYLRNAVRHQLVPVIAGLFPNAVQNISNSISRFAEAELLYRKGIEQERKKLLQQRGADYYIPILKLRHRQPLATICYELLQPFGFSSGQIPFILGLLQGISGHYVASATHRVIRHRDFLVIAPLPPESADLVLVEQIPCSVAAGKYVFHFAEEDVPKTIPTHPHTAYIDATKVEYPLVIRKWRMGDYLYPLGMGMKKKKVARILIDAKLPLHEKEHIRIVECNKKIVWLAGLRLDERHKVHAATQRVLTIRMEERGR